MNLREQALSLLSRFYGYHSFRPGQLEVIEAVASGRDAVVLMPTGGGKSLCYQLPALLAPSGLAVVVSPLIALMQDQTAALMANGIPAATLNSNQDEAYNRSVMDAARAGKLRLLYTSPERLIQSFEWFRNLDINLFAIDEAHCISQWGHDFRPVYTELARLRTEMPGVPVIALTATADRLTRDDIVAQLRLQNPYCLLGSFDRPNISLSAYYKVSAHDRVKFINRLIKKYPQDTGISYSLSRSGAEGMCKALRTFGVRAVCYHAGMSAQERNDSMKAFLDGSAQVVCATIAFGMGIDKSNIRWVVHNNLPQNIESYYQEIGRAGRDGLPAEAVLFYSLGDLMTRRSFADESGQTKLNHDKLQRMYDYADARVCRRRILLSYFSEERNCDCGNCDICLSPPHRFDGTILAQKAISAVMRTGGTAIGVFTLTNILRGVRNSGIATRGYDRIKTFGAGSDLSHAEWMDYISQMVQLGVFEIAYDDYNHLRVTAFGMKVLRSQEPFQLSVHVPARREESLPKGRREESKRQSDPVLELFAHLKNVRTEVARKENMPPDLVFSDPSLLDMARQSPTSIEEFVKVSGVSERKGVRFGRRFIAAIRKFKGLSAQQSGDTLRETLILFNSGESLGDIARIKGVKLYTIQTHIAQLITDGFITTYGSFISRREYETIVTELREHPDTAYDTLKDRVDPGLIPIARAIRDRAQNKTDDK